MPSITLLLACLWAVVPAATPAKSRLDYTLRVDRADLGGVAVELRIRNAPGRLRLAAHAHPEYDDRYWRHLEALHHDRSLADSGQRGRAEHPWRHPNSFRDRRGGQPLRNLDEVPGGATG